MGTITDLSHQKKNKDRVNVYIDGSFACGLDALTVVKNRLTVGTKIDEDELAAIQRESEGGRAFERAVKYASVRSRTKKELRTFLRDKGYAPATLRLLTSTEGEPMGEVSNSRSLPTSVISLSSW